MISTFLLGSCVRVIDISNYWFGWEGVISGIYPSRGDFLYNVTFTTRRGNRYTNEYMESDLKLIAPPITGMKIRIV